MAFQNYTQQCKSCGNTTDLVYNAETQLWWCPVCGTFTTRLEMPDSRFSIKSVVRQVLIDIASDNMDSARNNLIECDKMEPRYIGTVIAHAAFLYNTILRRPMSAPERNNMMAQLVKYRNEIKESGQTPGDEETALYSSLDSSEAVGVLLLMYDGFQMPQRRDAMNAYFTPGAVYSLRLNNDLADYAIRNSRYDMFDNIVKDSSSLELSSVLGTVLNDYPDTERKAADIGAMLDNGGTMTEEDRKKVTDYLTKSGDSTATKYAVVKTLLDRSVFLPVETVMRTVVSRLDDTEKVSGLIRLMTQKRLLDSEVSALVEYGILECAPAVCGLILRQLQSTGQYVELTYKHYLAVLRKNCPVKTRLELLDTAMQFRPTEKTKELFVSEYLCTVGAPPEERAEILDRLFTVTETLSTASVERYLFSVTLDGEKKPEIVKKLFGMRINLSFFRSTLSNYLTRSSDPPAVFKEVTGVLLAAGLTASPAAVLSALTATGLDTKTKLDILRAALSAGVPGSELFDAYVTNVRGNTYDAAVFRELLAGAPAVSENALRRYLLQFVDGAAKRDLARQMLRQCHTAPDLIRCNVSVANMTVSCNLPQAYLLLTPDDGETASAILSMLAVNKNALQSDVLAGGERKKFRKYAASVRSALSPVAANLCAKFL